jgi:hypothetical protein
MAAFTAVTSRVRSSGRSNCGGLAIGRRTAQAFTEIHAYGFDQSQLYSDEGPPIEPWPRRRGPRFLEIAVWVLRHHFFALGLSAKRCAILL